MIQIISYQNKYKKGVIDVVLEIVKKDYGRPEDTASSLPDLTNIPELYQKNNGNFWIALDNEKVIGTIALRNYGKGRGYLKRMYLNDRYRGKGIAQKLLNTLIDFARDKNYTTIFLGTEEKNIVANKFYQKEGFEKIDKLPTDLPDFGDTVFYKIDLSQKKY